MHMTGPKIYEFNEQEYITHSRTGFVHILLKETDALCACRHFQSNWILQWCFAIIVGFFTSTFKS